jgi:hypothetical protein
LSGRVPTSSIITLLPLGARSNIPRGFGVQDVVVVCPGGYKLSITPLPPGAGENVPLGIWGSGFEVEARPYHDRLHYYFHVSLYRVMSLVIVRAKRYAADLRCCGSYDSSS